MAREIDKKRNAGTTIPYVISVGVSQRCRVR